MLKLRDLANRRDFSFGPLRVSPSRRLVTGPAGEVHVEPITMQVFLLLLDAKGEVVTRARLFDEVWGEAAVGDYSLNRAITMVRRITAETSPGAFEIENIPRTGYRLVSNGVRHKGRPRNALQYAIGGVGFVAAAAGAWFYFASTPSAPTIAIVAGNGHRLSVTLAESIATAVATNTGAGKSKFQVMTPAGSDGFGADFVLTVRGASNGAQRRAELNLVSSKNDALLWASSLADHSSASLEQQASRMGEAVLDCASDAHLAGPSAVDEATLRLYLTTCSKFEALHGAQLILLVEALEDVVADAPTLRGAWSRLFASKAELIDMEIGASPISGSLRRDLAKATALGVEVPEAYLARGALLPRNDRFERLRITEEGLAKYPDNLPLILNRAWQLRIVGRLADAGKAAMLAVSKYPRSPAAYTELANALMFSGRLDAARAVLRRASEVAPDAPNVTSALHRFETRYGNPRYALRALSSGEYVGDEQLLSYLNARADPTVANVDKAINSLMAAYRADPRDPSLIAQAMGEFGKTERAIQLLLEYPYAHVSGDVAEILFRPSLGEVRRDPRFIRIAHRLGVTNYWLRSGHWGDFCLDPTLPYSCRREVAGLS